MKMLPNFSFIIKAIEKSVFVSTNSHNFIVFREGHRLKAGFWKDLEQISVLNMTESLTYGGTPKCSEEANCDTPIVYETYIQGLLQCYSINVIMHMRCKKMHEPKSSILSLKIFVSCAFH